MGRIRLDPAGREQYQRAPAGQMAAGRPQRPATMPGIDGYQVLGKRGQGSQHRPVGGQQAYLVAAQTGQECGRINQARVVGDHQRGLAGGRRRSVMKLKLRCPYLRDFGRRLGQPAMRDRVIETGQTGSKSAAGPG